jgi:hypothetical protein
MIMHRHSKKFKLFFIPVAVTALGFLVMLLWNSFVPEVFNIGKITFWQALGLFILTRILFGGYFRGFRDHHDLRHEWRNKWEKMSPEERKAFIEKTRFGFRHFGHEAGPQQEQPGSRE